MGYSHVGSCFYIDSDKQIHDDPGYWFRFLDIVEGSFDSLWKKGRVGAVDDHDMDLYQVAVSNWNVDF